MFKSIAQYFQRRRLGEPTANQARLIDSLRRQIDLLPPLHTSDGSAALEQWTQNRRRLRELVLKDDPRRFLQWDVIRRTMFTGNAGYVATELKALQAAADWRDRWRPAIE